MTAIAFHPRQYQALMIDHILAAPRCALWASMGSGKSVATLIALDLLSLVEPGPALVIAPLRVAQSTWPDEVRKWQHLRHLRVSVICGTATERRAALARPAEIYTVNFEQLPWLVDELGDDWPFATVVVDEATKLKGFRLRQGTQRARALAKVAHTKVQRLIELTGTPAPNGLIDLYGQAWFLDAGQRLGRTFDGFSQRWFRPAFNGFGLEPLPAAREQIEDRLRDLCLTIDARDWFDIREPISNVIRVELPAKARALYRDMEREMFMELAGAEVEAFNAAARTNKCLQLANGAAYIDKAAAEWVEVHTAKLQALESVIEEAAGMPVLVAYNFRSDLARLAKAFPKGRHLDKDPQTLRDWNAGHIPLLFAHPASAGHGLSLQDGGNILVFFAVNWNLEEHQQIVERIGPTRQAQSGHDRPVFIHYILAADTVDELVLARLQTKRDVQDLLLEAMKKDRNATTL